MLESLRRDAQALKTKDVLALMLQSATFVAVLISTVIAIVELMQ
ncbi:hypothetical protein [Furfurilactobacillus rossiae]|nr:hypothetical protein [Furfurilactobacillus rossiae]QLE61859.1 hypothetical protein LROSRS0_1814 [Furfurilactobacillus rossiae]